MSQSTIVEWLNENKMRSFPLTENSPRAVTLNSTIYDLYQIIVDAMIVYSELPTSVNVTSITTTATDLVITVTDQPDFTVVDYVTAEYPQYIRNALNSLIVIDSYAAGLPSEQTATLTDVEFEPGITYEIALNTRGVSSLTIEGSNTCGTFTSGALTGDVVLTEGYQISLIPTSHKLRIEVGKNEGRVLPCDSETCVVSDCTTLVSSVDGVSPTITGNPIKLVGKNHVVIFDDLDNNRVYIGLDFTVADVPVQVLPTPVHII